MPITREDREGISIPMELDGKGKEIPDDVVFDILSRLPVQSLLKFRCVCKSWNDLISNNSQFINSQLQRSIESNCSQKLMLFEYSSKKIGFIGYEISDHGRKKIDTPLYNRYRNIEVLCSCNGVVLLRVIEAATFILWNHVIRKTKCVVFLPKYRFGRSASFGLCYDSSVDSYKILNTGNDELVLRVYDVKSKCLTVKETNYLILRDSPGVVANGMVHWVGFRWDDCSVAIVYYDLLEAGFKEVSKPVDNVLDAADIGLAVLRGQLCFYSFTLAKKLEIWVMKEYGKKESWTNLMVIPKIRNVRRLKVLSFTEKGEVLLELDERELVVYNSSESTFRTIIKKCGSITGWTMTSYVESLVLLNTKGKKEKKTKR